MHHLCLNEMKDTLQGKMSVRRRHTEAKIKALADHFKQSWSDGQLIKSWLRAHADELRDLVKREDWAWTNVGKALTLAGISYQTGHPWKGENIRKELIKACLPREQRKTAMIDPLPLPIALRHSPPGESEFQLIRRNPTDIRPHAPSFTSAVANTRPKRNLSAEEVHAIALGRSTEGKIRRSS